MFLMMLDGGYAFTSKLNGACRRRCRCDPSEYVPAPGARRRRSPTSSPANLERKGGDLFMACSDYPHSEGTATPIEDYQRTGTDPAAHPALFGDNAAFLLRV